MEHSHSEQKEQEWQAQEALFTRIKELGVQKYLETLPDLEKAFNLKDHCLRCMDEGTPGGIHMAGSGILDNEVAKELVRLGKVEGIYSHDGCGAAALFAKKKNLDTSKSDEYGIAWAKALAEKAGLPYSGHITFEQMSRPREMHVARVAYYDGTGNFDPSQVAGLPPGFVISRRFLDGAYAKQEVEIAASIALGDHGFGDRLNAESPFLVIAVGDNRKGGIMRESLESEIAEIIKKQSGRVISAGFTAPLE